MQEEDNTSAFLHYETVNLSKMKIECSQMRTLCFLLPLLLLLLMTSSAPIRKKFPDTVKEPQFLLSDQSRTFAEMAIVNYLKNVTKDFEFRYQNFVGEFPGIC